MDIWSILIFTVISSIVNIFLYIFLYFISMGGINRREFARNVEDKVKFSKICVNFHFK